MASVGGRSHLSDKGRQLHPKSPALLLELQLKESFEKNQKTPCRERVTTCMTVLDQAIPYLGAYQQVMKTVRDELYRSVYSKEMTSTSVEPFVERIPYFGIVNRLNGEKTSEIEYLREQVSELHRKYKSKDKELAELQAKYAILEDAKRNSDIMMASAEQEKAQMSRKLMSVENEHSTSVKSGNELNETLKKDVEHLKESLVNANILIKKLSSFDAEMKQDDITDEQVSTRHEHIAEPQVLNQYDINMCNDLIQQLSEVLIAITEDHETSLKLYSQRREYFEHALEKGQENEKSSIEENLEKLKQEYQDHARAYKKKVSALFEEQAKLEKHIKGLFVMKKRFAIDDAHFTLKRMADVSLRKYSSVLTYSDDNGQSFKHFKNVNTCVKCGDKTILCPHQNLPFQTISIPTNATHIMLTHPKLRLRTKMSNTPEQMEKVAKSLVGYLELEDVIADANKKVHDNSLDFEDEDENEDDILLQQAQLTAPTLFRIIWRDFYRYRNGRKPLISRKLPIEKCMAFIESVYDYRFKYEEAFYDDVKYVDNIEDKRMVQFKETFYEYLFSQYQVKEAALYVAHDLFSSLRTHLESDKGVELFLRQLSGNEDATWKYFYLCRKLFTKYGAMNVDIFRQIIHILYPSRTNDVYELLEIEHIAHSHNRFTVEECEKHLLHMMEINTEPCFAFFESMFQKSDASKKGHLHYDEFDSTMSSVAPHIPAWLKRCRFLLAALDTPKLVRKQNPKLNIALPIQRCAQIAMYCFINATYHDDWNPQDLKTGDAVEAMAQEEQNYVAKSESRQSLQSLNKSATISETKLVYSVMQNIENTHLEINDPPKMLFVSANEPDEFA